MNSVNKQIEIKNRLVVQYDRSKRLSAKAEGPIALLAFVTTLAILLSV